MNFLCIHGHFYQPPRENPWLEAVETQESAEPYHDWNQRIAAECYAPNARCRILDGDGRITRLVNNYSRISFNVGPTLLSWLETHDPGTYAAILAADREGAARFGGHGPAIAQVYNHMIMPLANARDRRTQVQWGLADFRRRFGRMPEGMWLAEAAADTASLEELAAAKIAFTVLSPYQAARVRPRAGGEWTDASGGAVDPARPYLVKLPSGRSIAVFFYDGPVSQAIAFEKLLTSGEKLAARLLGAAPRAVEDDEDCLIHVATDGETYGHHVAYGDMALAYALDKIERGSQARLTVYGEYLELHPPEHEVQVVENSSWSCSHGVERWQADCGCRIGGKAGWTQSWREPLRAALDHLRDGLAVFFDRRGRELFLDPWAARDDYITVVLDRRTETVDAFLRKQSGRTMSHDEAVAALSLLEMQRNCLLMYTSCGWFFDELSGIETVQVIAYAGRAIQLAESLGETDIEAGFVAKLAKSKSNVGGDGRTIYEKQVRPQRVELAKVAAHFALAALFQDDPGQTPVYCYTVAADSLSAHAGPTPHARLVHGRLSVTSSLTREEADFAFAAVHLGDLNLRGGVRPAGAPAADEARARRLEAALLRPDLPELLGLLDAEYDSAHYSLTAVFNDERRKLLTRMLRSTADDLESAYRRLVDEHGPTMMIVQGLDIPLLPAFRNAARFVALLDLRRAFDRDEPDLDEIARLVDEAVTWDLAADAAGLNFAAQQLVARVVARLHGTVDDARRVKRCVRLLDLIESLGLKPDYWKAQNVYYDMAQAEYLSLAGPARQLFADLGRRLRVRVHS